MAQTDQVLDVHHRPGNVHDSNGADAFIGQCFAGLRATVPGAKAETRMDSAFFNDTIVDGLEDLPQRRGEIRGGFEGPNVIVYNGY